MATIFLNEIPEMEATSEVIEGLVGVLVKRTKPLGEMFRFGGVTEE